MLVSVHEVTPARWQEAAAGHHGGYLVWNFLATGRNTEGGVYRHCDRICVAQVRAAGPQLTGHTGRDEMSGRIRVLHRVVQHVRVPVKLLRVARVRRDRVSLREAADVCVVAAARRSDRCRSASRAAARCTSCPWGLSVESGAILLSADVAERVVARPRLERAGGGRDERGTAEMVAGDVAECRRLLSWRCAGR